MIPVLTPEEMAEVDRDAPEPVEVLVHRAASEVARTALDLLGGGYGRRVVVVAGPGNNGEDGRVAGRLLERRGVRVAVVDATDPPATLPRADLVVDAAFGTGFRGTYGFPDPDGAPVLAVDVPSGLDGRTGAVGGAPAAALATVTFAALKPGQLLGSGPSLCGEVSVADIGLDVSGATVHLVEESDLATLVPSRRPDDHKWRHAVWVVAGSPGMSGAASLCAAGAQRGGAGYVRLSTPGEAHPDGPVEAVRHPLGDDWAAGVVDGAGRFGSVVAGPGLGRDGDAVAGVRSLVRSLPVPLVLDGDALFALGTDVVELLADRPGPTVLTPHDGEFAGLTGSPVPADRLAAVRSLAAAAGCVVLLKGPTTLVADADGEVLVVRAGDQRLATAGTGDVLAGLVGANLALGSPAASAAAAAAMIHGGAARRCAPRGMVASDLIDAVPQYLAEVVPGRR